MRGESTCRVCVLRVRILPEVKRCKSRSFGINRVWGLGSGVWGLLGSWVWQVGFYLSECNVPA